MQKKILLIPGDGIGKEIVDEAVKVLNKVAGKFDHEFSYDEALLGAVAIDETGDPYPEDTKKKAREADAILLGAVGDPKYDDPSLKVRPEQGILAIRKDLELFSNLRPVKIFDALVDSSPLKPEIARNTDLIFFRELTGGIYFGTPRERRDNGNTAVDTMIYSKDEVRRISKLAFEAAMKRRKKVTSVDKSNVLECSRLWRETVEEVAKGYPEVELEHQLVDSATMRLIKEPTAFDVILTGNMFGDILSDEAAQVGGSLGMLASASMGEKFALYEPAHGSAPKYKGLNKANPIATIMSAQMMLELSFDMKEEAQAIDKAISKVLGDGYRTKDIATENTPDEKRLGTKEMGDMIAQNI
ncbi:MAG TPA: 3-isopropylmalate dehydrogenase [Candidatus Dojkabacteria bacterium]|jgi:3-isopropylmalate dehydrogenase